MQNFKSKTIRNCLIINKLLEQDAAMHKQYNETEKIDNRRYLSRTWHIKKNVFGNEEENNGWSTASDMSGNLMFKQINIMN